MKPEWTSQEKIHIDNFKDCKEYLRDTEDRMLAIAANLQSILDEQTQKETPDRKLISGLSSAIADIHRLVSPRLNADWQ